MAQVGSCSGSCLAARQARDAIPVLSDPGTVLGEGRFVEAAADCLADPRRRLRRLLRLPPFGRDEPVTALAVSQLRFLSTRSATTGFTSGPAVQNARMPSGRSPPCCDVYGRGPQRPLDSQDQFKLAGLDPKARAALRAGRVADAGPVLRLHVFARRRVVDPSQRATAAQALPK